jgi:lipid-binding SYLF domain-containing protein
MHTKTCMRLHESHRPTCQVESRQERQAALLQGIQPQFLRIGQVTGGRFGEGCVCGERR